MKRIIITALVLLLLIVSRSARAGDWTTVATSNAGKGANNLLGVAAIAEDNVWSVGFEFNTQLSAYQTLVQHWNGSRWSIVRSPNANTSWNFLSALAVNSANDIWAVGQALNGSLYNTLIERWNGRQWLIVPSPSMTGVSNDLLSVEVISTNDVWAVGYTQASNIFKPLAVHWDGAAWSIITTPGQSRLNSVAAAASNDVWAVGVSEPSELSLTLHWDGTAWTIVPSPNDSTEDNILWHVTALASNDVWAVGAAGSLKTLGIHWDGAQWNLVPMPAFGNDISNEVLVGMVANSSTDIWAVGQYLVPLLGSAQQTLTEHWDGVSWSVVTSPNAKNSNNRLSSVTVTPTGTLWAVGTVGPFGKAEHTLAITKAP